MLVTAGYSSVEITHFKELVMVNCNVANQGLRPGLLPGGRAISQANWQPASLTGAHSRM